MGTFPVLRIFRKPSITVLLLLQACSGSRPDEPMAIDTFPLEQGLTDPESPASNECDLDQVKCTKGEQAPENMLCLTRGLQNQVFIRPHEPKGWGASACEAKKQLVENLCNAKISPKSVDKIHCIPDAASGNCPAKIEECPDTEKPQLCTATMYMDQKLERNRSVKVFGNNRCHAMNAIRNLACHMLYDPLKITHIACKIIKEPPEECPSQVRVCEKLFNPTTCQAERYDGEELEQMITAQGNSPCEAQAQVYFLACQRELLPSKLGAMECNSTPKRNSR